MTRWWPAGPGEPPTRAAPGSWFVSVEAEVRASAARPELGVGERLEAPGIAQLERARARGMQVAVLTRDRAFYGEDLDWIVDRWVGCETLSGGSIASAVGELAGPVLALTSSVDCFLGPAATAARVLGLRGPSPGSPAFARDEQSVRVALRAAGVPVVPWASLPAEDPAPSSPVGYPCVVAPVGAGRRTDAGLAVDEPELRALTAGQARSPRGPGAEARRLLLQEYVPGPRYSADGFVVGGEPVVLAWSENVMALPPEFVVTAATATSRPPTAGAEAFVRAAVGAAGYDAGPFHLDFVLGPGGPLLVSLQPRTADPGGQFCVDQVSGLDTADLAVALLLGEAVSVTSSPGRAVAASTRMSLVSHAPGRVLGVTGLAEVARIPGLLVAEVFGGAGATGSALGHVLTVGSTPTQARRRAAYAVDGIRLDVEELQAA